MTAHAHTEHVAGCFRCELSADQARYERFGPWQRRDYKADDIYPGFLCWDQMQTGSICANPYRIPLWAFVWELVDGGYAKADYSYGLADTDVTPEVLAGFLHDLLELRGEFGRLLLTMAAAERAERRRNQWDAPAWWETKKWRKKVGDQLRRCLDVLEDDRP